MRALFYPYLFLSHFYIPFSMCTNVLPCLHIFKLSLWFTIIALLTAVPGLIVDSFKA
jgi:hypothetical protein